MAQRRMFSKSVTNNDNFIELPATSQNLYFHLSMNADDDGFVDNWKSIMRMIGSKEDDIKILIAKSFLIPFESGVIVIKHWRLNNYLQSDRKKPTVYQEEYKILSVDNNNVYKLDTECIHSIGKDSIDNNINIISETDETKTKKSNVFKKPSIEEIKEYCLERNNSIDAEYFYDFYESKNWYVGKNKMKDWKASIRTWERNNKTSTNDKTKKSDIVVC